MAGLPASGAKVGIFPIVFGNVPNWAFNGIFTEPVLSLFNQGPPLSAAPIRLKPLLRTAPLTSGPVTSAVFGKPWMPPIEYVPIWRDPVANLSMAFLPAVTVGYRYAAVSMRMTRSAMLEVMQEDYIRTARAKGLIQKLIVNRHALKNALLPVVTLIGIEFAFLIGGLVVTEQVFNLNGVGRLFVQAVQNQDYTLSQALVMLTVIVFVICNLIVDLLYAWLDPRIRFS